MKNMTRRSFLKTAALSAAGMTALSMGAAAAENAEKPAYLPEKWDYEADVVVCGYGVVGAMAAREAIAQGASCLVLEKASDALSGGAGISSAGAVFPNNPLAMHA
jgi:heterodisulfide reductase subunit A-like polyferredoxin